MFGCGLVIATAYAADPAPAAPNLHHLMKNVVAIQTQVIWDVGNNAQDDKGNPDASKMKAADWTKAAAAAGKVKEAAQTLAKAPHVMAAAPGERSTVKVARRAPSARRKCRRRSTRNRRCSRPSRRSSSARWMS
jgi:hypothetical protein